MFLAIVANVALSSAASAASKKWPAPAQSFITGLSDTPKPMTQTVTLRFLTSAQANGEAVLDVLGQRRCAEPGVQRRWSSGSSP